MVNLLTKKSIGVNSQGGEGKTPTLEFKKKINHKRMSMKKEIISGVRSRAKKKDEVTLEYLEGPVESGRVRESTQAESGRRGPMDKGW